MSISKIQKSSKLSASDYCRILHDIYVKGKCAKPLKNKYRINRRILSKFYVATLHGETGVIVA